MSYAPKQGAFNIKVELIGFDRISQIFKSGDKIIRGAVIEALAVEAEKVLMRSIDLVPIDTARLMQSGRVIRPPKNMRNPEFNIVYGGITVRGEVVDYAYKVHEDVNVPHKNGQAKFLTKAFSEILPGIEKRVEARINSSKFR